MSDRFYCPGPWRDGLARLEGDEGRHLARVRRVGVGACVTLFDGEGRSGLAEVVEIARDRVELRLLGDAGADRAVAGPLVLATAVPKGDRFDWLVEKATEIGVSRLVPLITERSVVDPRSTKIDRLRRLVVEASKQSGRNRLMEISRPLSLTDWLGAPVEGVDACYLAHPSGGRIGDGPTPEIDRGVAIAIGPEGGFTDSEVESAIFAGYRVIGLGPTLLRIETAAIAACIAVLTCAK